MAALTANQAAWLESRGVAGPFRALASGFRSDVLESASGFVVRLGRTPADCNTFSAEQRVMDAARELRGLDWALRNPDAGELDDAAGKVAAALAAYV